MYYQRRNIQLNYKIFQICFQQDQISQVDPLLTPFDNTENKYPELREYHNFNRIIDEGFTDNLDAWGIFGPRWQEKLRYSAANIKDAVDHNPGYDIYLFNYGRALAALTQNVWEQSDFFHKGIKRVTIAAFRAGGYDTSVFDKVMTDYTCYCSYFIATKAFWKDYILFVRDIKKKLDELTGEDGEIYNSVSNYHRDQKLGLFPFIVERLLPTFLYLKNYKVYNKPYDCTVYKGQISNTHIGALESLYKLKAFSQKNSAPDILKCWQILRVFAISERPGILNTDEPLSSFAMYPEILNINSEKLNLP